MRKASAILVIAAVAAAATIIGQSTTTYGAESIATIAVDCASSGQLCDRPFSVAVATAGGLQAEYQASTGHCSAVRVYFAVDGQLKHTSAFLTAGQSTGLVDLGPVSAGTHTVSVQAEGKVGGCNSGTLARWEGTLKVVTTEFAFSGFFQPIDNRPTLNSVKAGSAVPMKFSLAGNQGLSIFAAGSPASQRIACESSAPESLDTPTVTAGGSSLSYDATADQYVYVWKTDAAWAGTCQQLIVSLVDGSVHTAIFKFK